MLAFLSSLALGTRKYVCKLDDVRKHSTFASADVDSWILFLLFTLKSRHCLVKRTKEQQHLKTLLSQQCETFGGQTQPQLLPSDEPDVGKAELICGDIRPPAFALCCCSFKRWKRETTLNSTLCENSYWYVLPDNFIKHPAQTFSDRRIHGSSVFISLNFSFCYLTKMGVGKVPKIIKEWRCHREANDKMSFYSCWCVLLSSFGCREAEMVSQEN